MKYTESLQEWPSCFSKGLDEMLEAYVDDKYSAIAFANKFISGTYLGSLIEKVSWRFSDDLADCWHLLCPWFFPSDFSFKGDDEGSIFQNKVRGRQLKSSYIIPESDNFSKLRPIIFSSLERKSVTFGLGKKISFKQAAEIASNKRNIAIWCASSYGLLRSINCSMATKSIASRRHMNLFLFSMDVKAFETWTKNFSCLPSEILYLETSAPELNRISFPQPLHQKVLGSVLRVYLLAECFTREETPSNNTGTSIKLCLERQFSTAIKFEGQAYGRPMSTFSSHVYPEAVSAVKAFASEVGMVIPEIYFGPINMAKCGIIANDFVCSMT